MCMYNCVYVYVSVCASMCMRIENICSQLLLTFQYDIMFTINRTTTLYVDNK